MHHPRLALCLVLLAAGCGKKGDAAAESKDDKVEKAEKPAAEKAPPKDDKLVDFVKKLAETCTVNVESGQAYSCKGDTNDKLRDYVRKEKPKEFFSTLVQEILDGEEKESATAIAVLDENFSYLGADELKTWATKYTVDKLLEALKKNKGNRATRIAGVTTHLSVLAGRADDLYAVIDKHESKYAQDKAYGNLMTHGRLKVLPKLKEVAKDKTHAAAALGAPRNMYKATDDERAEYCPWAEGYLGDDDANVASAAGYVMVNCKGKWIDSLLGEAKKRVEAGKYKNPFAMVMREPCFEFISGVSGKAGASPQCEAVFEFLEKTANDKRVDDETRGMALWNIYYQRRDKKTLDLMRKYEKSPVKAIADRAKEAIKSLTETYKLK